MTRRAVIFNLLALFISACAEKQPDAVAVDAFVGCYTASNAPSLRISATKLRAEGGPQVPSRFVMRKIGLVLSTPLMVEGDREQIRFVKVEDDYDYRVLRGDAGARILVSTARGSTISYSRVSTNKCFR